MVSRFDWRSTASAGVTLIALLLGGCEEDRTISVDRLDDGRLRVSVTGPKPGLEVCVSSIHIAETGRQDRLLWGAELGDPRRCSDRLVVPGPTDGYYTSEDRHKIGRAHV